MYLLANFLCHCLLVLCRFCDNRHTVFAQSGLKWPFLQWFTYSQYKSSSAELNDASNSSVCLSLFRFSKRNKWMHKIQRQIIEWARIEMEKHTMEFHFNACMNDENENAMKLVCVRVLLITMLELQSKPKLSIEHFKCCRNKPQHFRLSNLSPSQSVHQIKIGRPKCLLPEMVRYI